MATLPTNPTPLPTPPSTSDPTNFDARGDAFLGALPNFQTQTNDQAVTTYNNAVEAFQSANTSTSAKNDSVAAKAASEAARDTSVAAKNLSVSSRDDIQRLYLGAKSTPPTVDNTGQPLQAGVWYTNTTDDFWYWYTGTAWKLGVGDLSTVDFETQVTGKPNTVEGYHITNAVTTDPPSLGAINLNSAASIAKNGFFRVESPTGGPVGHNVDFSQYIVSHNFDTVTQMIFSYSSNVGWMRSGTTSNFNTKAWKPIGNHPLKYVDDNTNYMYGDENGGLNTVNVFRASGNIAKYLPKYPVDGDMCTIVIANARADNTVHPAAGSGHKIMGLAEPMTIDNSAATVTFVYASGGYGWRIK